MSLVGRRIEVRGTVQGVGFRPWLYHLASEVGISGRVCNDPRGVTIDAFGTGDAVGRFLNRIQGEKPAAAEVREVRSAEIPWEGLSGFSIVASRQEGARSVAIPPDLATCPDCLREVSSPADRRYRYAFTNCTSCGPRYTIAQDVPYDRARTTMAEFEMCPRCAAEYADVGDRRFHAQPNACPRCGPRLHLVGADVKPEESDEPLRSAARRLGSGAIVAVKGLGGYHLACDATDASAVARLRERKRRDEKPFAVMVADLPAAHRLAELNAAEERLLASVERPIVLARRRAESGLADGVAPGSSLVGVMLAYTPLHHLLLAEVARPLVMTSGNLSEEPMAVRDADACERLRDVADLFLTHDRRIENRCDDSVVRVVRGRPTILRRARGFVPRPITLRRPVARPVLACGGQLKNTFCLAAGDQAWLGPHVGDLDHLEAWHDFEEQVDRMEAFLGVRPEVVAYDLHPEYLSTAYARGRAEPAKVAVQHHHAHAASAMAEHGLAGPVLALAWDGTGYGTDGTAWGGELLLAREDGYDRLATFRPLALAGADAAIRHVWRVALAALDDAFDQAPPLDALELFRAVPASEVGIVRRMTARRLNAPLARGVGRYFDAAGAIGLARANATYEGQVALEWNLAAGDSPAFPYEFRLGRVGELIEVDLRPAMRELVAELVAGSTVREVASRFHETLGAAGAALVHLAVKEHGKRPVVLTGGCFQNPRLVDALCARLVGLDVRLHGQVPPGDGGIALGQALVADAVTRS